MTVYKYKVVREYMGGKQAKRAKIFTTCDSLTVGGLYVRLGKGYPGMQRVISEEAREIECWGI